MAEMIAAVHILDVPYHADREYDYYVPAEMQNDIRVGLQINVPYGVSNRKMAAVVTELKTASAHEHVKPILSLSASGTCLTEEMLSICRFLKEHTLCTIGDAVRTVIPAAAISKIAEYYSAIRTEEAEKKLSKMGDKAAFVYSFIAARERVSAARLRAEFGAECHDLLTALVRAELILRETEVHESRNIRHRRFFSIVPALTEEDAFAKAIRTMRSQAQAEILRTLRTNGEMLEEDLTAVTGTSRAQISSLLKKDLIRERLEEDFRNPFTDKETPSDVGSSPLSDEQQNAHDTLCALYGSGEAKAALLHGVTGSGKTRVILSMIDRVREDGKGAIILVPEISLTPQMVGIFLARYGDRVAVIHSSLSAGERYDAWRRIRDGLADVVIGTRSAIFAPIDRIGLIVIDEEQEHTYKSETNPKYLTHDVAAFRCGRHNALMLLASATPSVTSYYKAKSGKYTLIEMKKRYGKAVLPHVVITDMRGEPGGGMLSPLGTTLRDHLTENRAAGHQSILFLNRRGYNSFISCRTCGEVLKCPNCSVSLTYHVFRPLGESESPEEYRRTRADSGVLSCHYCGFRTRVPDTCPSCKSVHFHFRGYGTQMLEGELAKLDPAPRVLRMDMDTTQAKFSHEEILGAFRKGEADVLLGTQMVTKGHDFPSVTLVGVINADASLYLDDYRASERTFAMLTQVIGRAGRASLPGTAVIQTFNPANDVLTLAANQDYPEFYRREIRVRESLVFPPFCDIALITLASRDETLLASATARLREWIAQALAGPYADIKMIVFGPFEAPVYKIQGVCRNRIVIKCRLSKRTRQFISDILTEFGKGAGKRLTVSADLNPNTL
ncbi:MAG: primosomal protein N' [Clostridia bacterium]|nr:primosomal protein N' [Clostridia bacterium]